MTKFWPAGLDLRDTESPADILRKAQVEWHGNSSGLLALVFQTEKKKSGEDRIIVHAKHIPSNRTAELFLITHRSNTPYPVAIQPNEYELPKSLKKKYYQENEHEYEMRDHEPDAGYTVENPWVADTPSELRLLLEKAFNLGSVKSVILNLVSSYSSDFNANELESNSSPEDADADRNESTN